MRNGKKYAPHNTENEAILIKSSWYMFIYEYRYNNKAYILEHCIGLSDVCVCVMVSFSACLFCNFLFACARQRSAAIMEGDLYNSIKIRKFVASKWKGVVLWYPLLVSTSQRMHTKLMLLFRSGHNVNVSLYSRKCARISKPVHIVNVEQLGYINALHLTFHSFHRHYQIELDPYLYVTLQNRLKIFNAIYRKVIVKRTDFIHTPTLCVHNFVRRRFNF